MTEVSLLQNQDIERHQTSRDRPNIERKSIPQKRKLWSWLVPILCFVNTILIIVYGWRKKKIKVLINIGLSLLAVLLATIVRCLCNVVEELFQFKSRYNRNFRKLFKQCFSGILWRPFFAVLIIDVIFCIVAKIATGFSFDLEDVILISSGISVVPLVAYLLKLNAQSDVDLSRLLEGKWLHPAYILAWNYYINYLEKALPVFNRLFSSRSSPLQAQRLNECSDRNTRSQAKVKLSLNKLILLFSENYKKELRFVDLDNHTSKITDICEAGYKFPVYSLNYNRNKYKFVILFAEEPLESIKRIRDFERRKLIHSELLYRTLVSEILSKDNFCRNKCIPILISETQSLDNGGLVKLIMNDLQRKGCEPEHFNARDDTESPTPAMSTEQPHTEEPDDTQVPSSPGETSSSHESNESSDESSDEAIARADTEPHNPLVSTIDQPQKTDDTLVPRHRSPPAEGIYHTDGYLRQSSEKSIAPQLRWRKNKKSGYDSAMHKLETSSTILKGEIELIIQLEQWLGEKCKWDLCYRGSRDGWSAEDFHSHCDYKGPTVVLVKANDCIFGGYTDQRWESDASAFYYKHSNSSFLFSLRNKHNLAPFIANIEQGMEQYAIYCCPGYGPTFGGCHDLCISNNPQVRQSYSNFGRIYQLPPGYVFDSEQAKNLLAGQESFITTEIEVFN